jgi:hypothetical protein
MAAAAVQTLTLRDAPEVAPPPALARGPHHATAAASADAGGAAPLPAADSTARAARFARVLETPPRSLASSGASPEASPPPPMYGGGALLASPLMLTVPASPIAAPVGRPPAYSWSGAPRDDAFAARSRHVACPIGRQLEQLDDDAAAEQHSHEDAEPRSAGSSGGTTEELGLPPTGLRIVVVRAALARARGGVFSRGRTLRCTETRESRARNAPSDAHHAPPGPLLLTRACRWRRGWWRVDSRPNWCWCIGLIACGGALVRVRPRAWMW